MVVWQRDGVGGVRVMLKEEVCEMVEVRRVSDIFMVIVLVFEVDLLWLNLYSGGIKKIIGV